MFFLQTRERMLELFNTGKLFERRTNEEQEVENIAFLLYLRQLFGIFKGSAEFETK